MAVPIHTTPIPVYAGDSWSQSFTFKAGESPEDLTGWGDWECQWRPTADSTDEIVLSVAVSGDPTEGVIVVSATPEQTRAMGQSGQVDVQAVDGSTVRTFIRFKTKWTLDVTRVDA